MCIFQEYSEKLSKFNKKLIINLEIEECGKFIEKIKVFQRTNLKYLHTNKEAASEPKKTFSNVNKQERVGGQGQTDASGSQPNLNPHHKK